MKVEATREDIRVLLELTQLDGSTEPVVPEAQARARDEAEHRLPNDLLTRYRWLTAAGRYPVLVTVDRETCSGCHVRLATMLANLVKRSVGIYPCPRCRRMLYAPELLSEQPAQESGERKVGSRRSPRQTAAHHS
jgi:predicted  nucleic acid-binding Zn-ribbon protein